MSLPAFFSAQSPTPIVYLTTINGKRIFLKQDYLNHPTIQGNKLRKLKYTLLQAKRTGQTIVSFGGAYSNHIAALAAAGKAFNIDTIGIIRGEELADPNRWGTTLQQAHNNGMQLHFVSRSDYRKKHHSSAAQRGFDHVINPLIVPEGGTHPLALNGTAEIIDEVITQQPAEGFQRLFAACGTGGTLAGLIDGVAKHRLVCHVTGIAVLKSAQFLYDNVRNLSQYQHHVDWSIEYDYHAGGYAKTTSTLQRFIEQFHTTFNLPIEPIYTGKLCYGVFELAKQSHQQTENWLIYHSGGLQSIAHKNSHHSV